MVLDLRGEWRGQGEEAGGGVWWGGPSRHRGLYAKKLEDGRRYVCLGRGAGGPSEGVGQVNRAQ